MATTSGRTTTVVKPAVARPAPLDRSRRTVEQRLFADGPSFNFFQAVRLLEMLAPDRDPVGFDGSVGHEIVRFASYNSHNFPPSQIYDIRADRTGKAPPTMIVAFFGLTGPSGVLPRHYTDLLMRMTRDARHAEKFALRDWFDLFTHRMLSLFHRAWEKYRFYISYERRRHLAHPPDPFTHALLSLCGLGMSTLRDRLRVAIPGEHPGRADERVLAKVPDLAVAFYAGQMARRPRTAAGLAAMLADYFQMPVETRQFHGEWLQLDEADQSQLGCLEGHCALGLDTVIGERIWDVEGKILIRLGPLDYDQFVEMLPRRSPEPKSKGFFLLSHMTRLFIGPTLNFDVQLLLKADEAPDLLLGADEGPGARLGWNTWLGTGGGATTVDDAVFAGQELFQLDGASGTTSD